MLAERLQHSRRIGGRRRILPVEIGGSPVTAGRHIQIAVFLGALCPLDFLGAPLGGLLSPSFVQKLVKIAVVRLCARGDFQVIERLIVVALRTMLARAFDQLANSRVL